MLVYTNSSIIANACKRISGLISRRINMQSTQHDFSLESGERQTGKKLSDIRYDHRLRYQCAIDYLKSCYPVGEQSFGLDLFCGTGYGTSMIFTDLFCSILGIDGSGEAIDFANRHYAQNGTLFSHKRFPFSLPQNTFDFITCYESLEHVEDDVFLLEQLIASLKQNGLLFLSTPNERYLPLKKDFHKFHFKHYTINEVVNMTYSMGELKLITWFGQNLYKFDRDRFAGILSDHDMLLQERKEGQLLIFVFKKVVS